MRIVLLGDVHLYRLAVAPWHLLSKRVLGQMNLWVRRRYRFDMTALPAMIDRIRGLDPAMLLGSGDLTTTAVPGPRGDFELVRQKLGPLFDAVPTFIVPGNHDRYTFTAARHRYFEQAVGRHTVEAWPHHRQLGERLHLIGIDATRANIITDRGRIGPEVLQQLHEMMRPLTADDRLIVLCHYPIAMPPGHAPEHKRHALIDAAELTDELAACKADVLYLHGHVHEPQCWRHTTAENVTIINAGAPLMRSASWPSGQGFWQIDLDAATLDPPTLVHHARDGGGQWVAKSVDWPRRGGEVASIV